MQVRWARADDVPELGMVFFAAVREGPSLYSEAEREAWMPEPPKAAAWAARLAANEVAVVEAEGRTVGFMTLDAAGYIDLAFALPAYQRRGVFRTLYAAIEARAKARFEHEQAEHDAKLTARQEQAEKTGRKPGGRPPQPPTPGPTGKDQVNLTDPDSRIMPVAGGGFEQAYNAQAAVAAGSLLVVANDVVQAANDKQQITPMLDRLGRLAEVLDKPATVLADSGYFSEANVSACAEAGIAPLIAPGRERHHRSWQERFAAPPPAPQQPTPLAAMVHRLATPEGRQTYALRKQTPEPVFGIIKAVMGFRQFSLRGLDKAKGEWTLVTLAWNMKRMFALGCA